MCFHLHSTNPRQNQSLYTIKTCYLLNTGTFSLRHGVIFDPSFSIPIFQLLANLLHSHYFHHSLCSQYFIMNYPKSHLAGLQPNASLFFVSLIPLSQIIFLKYHFFYHYHFPVQESKIAVNFIKLSFLTLTTLHHLTTF